jgi:hypothetical protein
MKNDDLYISILRFGKEHLEQGLTFQKLLDHLDKIKLKYDETSVIVFFNELFMCKRHPEGNNVSQKPKDNEVYFLENEGYFKLLEYEELSEARQSSKKATTIAIIAIVISIIASTFSIYYSNMQLNTPTKIEESQIKIISNEKVVETVKDLESTQKQILNQVQQIKKQLVEYQKQNIQIPPTAKVSTD